MSKKQKQPTTIQTTPATVPWYRRIWVILTALGAVLGFVLLQGPTALQNAERLPSDIERVTGRFLSWYYDDKAWNGIWSAKPEGYADAGDMSLSDSDLMLNLVVEYGKVGGDLSTKAICKINPMFDFLMLEGKISGDTATILAFDFIGGKRENFFRFTAKREGIVMNVTLQEGFTDWIPQPVRIARHPGDGEDPYAKMSGLCAAEKEELMKQIRPAGLEKGVRKPIQ